MKIKSTFFVVFFNVLLGYGQDSNPPYETVVTQLFRQYNADSICKTNDVFLEKREVGWNVTTINPSSKDTITELFWNSQKSAYQSINFPPNPTKEVDEDAVSDFLNNSSSARYNSLWYYGYVGWDQDVIQSYENKKSLTDTELYGLGYAYSNYATGLLNDNFEFSNPKINFNLPISNNSMNAGQLQTYLSFINKSIACYHELYKRNPNFETIPGQIGIKYYNEIASNYLNLRIYQNEEVAQKEIQGLDLYSDNFKMYAKDMLDSCEKNAILFTAGDNDTFPLLMYQVQNNYRKDVLVVNTSLLQDERYALRMKDAVLDAKGIPLSLPTDFIKDIASEAVVFDISTEDEIAIHNLNIVISDESNFIATQTRNYKTFPSRNFSFGEGVKKMKWTIDRQAIYRSDLILLDIIATNNWERPIYFADNNSHESYLGLSEYLQFEGLVYQLGWKKGIVAESELGYLNVPKVEDNCKKMFQFKNKINLTIEERQMVMNYRLIYRRLADYYINNKQLEKAKSVLNECLVLYPNEMAYYSFDVVSIIECYYKLQLFNKGKEIELQLRNNFKKSWDNYSFLTEAERKSKYERTKKNLEYLTSFYDEK